MTVITSGVWPIDPTVTTGTELATYLNELVQAVNSSQSSASRPAMIVKGGIWTKTKGATDVDLMFFDGTTDFVVGSVVGGVAKFGGATFNSGATATKPATPSKGDMFWDTTLNQLEIYDGGAWINSTDSKYYTANDTTGVLSIKSGTTPTEAIAISASGEVGVGGTASGNKLFVNGLTFLQKSGTGVQEVLKLENSNTSAGVNSAKLAFTSAGVTKGSITSAIYGDGYMAFNTNDDTEKMRITGDGKVGIGVTAPGFPLDVYGPTSGPTLNLSSVDAYSSETSILMSSQRAKIASFKGAGGGVPGADLRFYTSKTDGTMLAQRMGINEDGFVGINQPNPAAFLDINDVGTATLINLNRNTGVGGNTISYSQGGQKFAVDSNGVVQSTSGAISVISDISQKENIVQIPYGLPEIMQLQPRQYDYKDGCASEAKGVLGFVAQEVEPVLPELVTEWGEGGLKALKTSDMIPVLVKAIQDQQAVIEDLKARIAKLEGTSKTVVR